MKFREYLETTTTKPFLLGAYRKFGMLPDWFKQLIARSPHGAQILSLIPDGTKPLGQGTLGQAFLTPDHQVIRIGVKQVRPHLPEVLQPIKTYDFGDYVVEFLPYAPSSGITWTNALQMKIDLLQKGWFFFDCKPENMGKTTNGQIYVIDPDALKSISDPKMIKYHLDQAIQTLHSLTSNPEEV